MSTIIEITEADWHLMSNNERICDHCLTALDDSRIFEQNGKRLHWSCVRQIVAERLHADEQLETFADKLQQTADERARALGFKTYDEYHRATYGY